MLSACRALTACQSWPLLPLSAQRKESPQLLLSATATPGDPCPHPALRTKALQSQIPGTRRETALAELGRRSCGRTWSEWSCGARGAQLAAGCPPRKCKGRVRNTPNARCLQRFQSILSLFWVTGFSSEVCSTPQTSLVGTYCTSCMLLLKYNRPKESAKTIKLEPFEFPVFIL